MIMLFHLYLNKSLSAYMLLLTVVIVHFKSSIKHEEGHISTSNIELGFKLT
jgi:hypothetical protein